MAKCSCYYQHGTKFVCYGTKEMEECSCGGDVRKCNFYPEKREQKTMTNADRIRAMSDEELADFITDKQKGWCTEIGREMYYQHNMEWLQQPAED